MLNAYTSLVLVNDGRVRPSILSRYWGDIFFGFDPISGQKLFRLPSGLCGPVLGRTFVAEGFLNGIWFLFVKFWIAVQSC